MTPINAVESNTLNVEKVRIGTRRRRSSPASTWMAPAKRRKLSMILTTMV